MDIEEMRRTVAEHDKQAADAFCDKLYGGLWDAMKSRLVELGMTQEALAIKAGIPPSHISKYLSGALHPGLKRVARMLEAVGVTATVVVERVQSE